jgi:hypothetical protein
VCPHQRRRANCRTVHHGSAVMRSGASAARLNGRPERAQRDPRGRPQNERQRSGYGSAHGKRRCYLVCESCASVLRGIAESDRSVSAPVRDLYLMRLKVLQSHKGLRSPSTPSKWVTTAPSTGWASAPPNTSSPRWLACQAPFPGMRCETPPAAPQSSATS